MDIFDAALDLVNSVAIHSNMAGFFFGFGLIVIIVSVWNASSKS